MGVLLFPFRDEAGTSLWTSVSGVCLYLLEVGSDSYGKVIEGRRECWCRRKSTGFQDFAVRWAENDASEAAGAGLVPRNSVLEEAAHCQGLARCLDATMTEKFPCLATWCLTVSHLLDVFLTPRVQREGLCRDRAEGEAVGNCLMFCNINWKTFL